MNIIYIHGLDSDANSTKGQLLENYCQQYHAEINVYRPDLNETPDKVFEQLLALIDSLDNENRNLHTQQGSVSNTVLVGSSLGGYFSTLVSNHTGCPALLLNPSTQPHKTLQRFADESVTSAANPQQVLYTTAGGWQVTNKDLQWFAEHQILTVAHPDKVAALIKQGDELLDSNLSATFYQQQGAKVILQAAGDHRFSDFAEHLPQVIDILQTLASK